MPHIQVTVTSTGIQQVPAMTVHRVNQITIGTMRLAHVNIFPVLCRSHGHMRLH